MCEAPFPPAHRCHPRFPSAVQAKPPTLPVCHSLPTHSKQSFTYGRCPACCRPSFCGHDLDAFDSMPPATASLCLRLPQVCLVLAFRGALASLPASRQSSSPPVFITLCCRRGFLILRPLSPPAGFFTFSPIGLGSFTGIARPSHCLGAPGRFVSAALLRAPL